jgi:hypothetical protein
MPHRPSRSSSTRRASSATHTTTTRRRRRNRHRHKSGHRGSGSSRRRHRSSSSSSRESSDEDGGSHTKKKKKSFLQEHQLKLLALAVAVAGGSVYFHKNEMNKLIENVKKMETDATHTKETHSTEMRNAKDAVMGVKVAAEAAREEHRQNMLRAGENIQKNKRKVEEIKASKQQMHADHHANSLHMFNEYKVRQNTVNKRVLTLEAEEEARKKTVGELNKTMLKLKENNNKLSSRHKQTNKVLSIYVPRDILKNLQENTSISADDESPIALSTLAGVVGRLFSGKPGV